MKLLFASAPAIGHVQPMIGLAVAALARGHEVAWAAAQEAWPLLVSHGIETLEAGVPFAAAFAEYRRRWPEVATLAPRQQAAHGFPRLFGRVLAEAMLPPLLRIVASWRPDLVVNEPGALAAPLAAAAHGVRHVTHAFGVPLPASILRDVESALAELGEAAGLRLAQPAMLYDHGAIEIAPRALLEACPNPGPACRTWAQRPASLDCSPGTSLPAALAEMLGRGARIVYASFGSLNRGGPTFGHLIQALAAAELTAVVSRGPVEVPEVSAPGLRIVDYVPQSLVLPHCAAVISHGGAGTTLAALAAGLPQLCLPQGADQFRNAEALAACGAALVLEPQAPTAAVDVDEIAAALVRLLADDALHAAAQRLRTQIDAMPAPAATMAALEGF